MSKDIEDMPSTDSLEGVYCKRCGRPHLTKDLEVDEETMKEYTRCALGGKPFSRTFNVLNNELQVTFLALPAEFEVALERLQAIADSDMYAIDLRMLLTLESIKVFDPDTSGMKTVYFADLEKRRAILEAPKKALEELASDVDAVLLGVLRRMSSTFVVLQNAILENIVNKDFYEGVGLV